MAALNKLTNLKVKNARPGKYNDGGGLWLVKRKDGGGQWVYRYEIHGRRREMGLGSISGVSVKQVRIDVEKWRQVKRIGEDPIKERDRLRRQSAREQPTLEAVFESAFEARKAQLKSDGKAGRWDTPLRLHVLPKLGKVPIEEIDQLDIKNALAPIWHAKAATAKKALNRIGIIFKHAAAMGLAVDMQANIKARALLGAQRHVPKNIPSLPWQEIPAFYASLGKPTNCHLALRLSILTACRSQEIRFCHVDEIEGDIWTIPATRMKDGKEHRVALCKEALAVIDEAIALNGEGFLFPNAHSGVISDATMSRMMERRGMEARPHGFRATFRTWCAEATDMPYEVSEAAIAHVTGSVVERTYRRTDFLEKRRTLMEKWSNHVLGQTGNVIKMQVADR